MLTQLCIKNFALIEECFLDFHTGMTVITGETGAGKSIILDALSLVLGARAENQPIRHGAEKCEIQAVFDLQSHPLIQQWLKEKDLEEDEAECFLRRIFSKEGRSKCFINHHPVSLQLLRELGEQLVTLHGQHEHQSLLLRETHRQCVDTYSHHENIISKLQASYQEHKKIEKELNQYQMQIPNRESKKEFLQYQLNELQQVNIESLDVNKIEQMEQEFKFFSGIKNNAQSYQEILHLIDNTLLPVLHKAQHLLPKSTQNDFQEHFDSADMHLNHILQEIRHVMEKYDVHPDAMETLEKKLDTLYHLSRKHHVSPKELPQQLKKIQEELNHLETLLISIDTLHKTLAELKQQYLDIAQKLSHQRKIAAEKIAKEVEQYLHALNMEHTKFAALLIPENDNNILYPNGLEKIEFHVSPNPGQPLQPLSKIASGGELSRISLAIDLVAAKDQTLPVLIFDEVDTGISGSTALKVGEMLKTLAQKAQVICITHLPQIASKAHHHLCVEKLIDAKQNKTDSHIYYLNTEQKIHAIAKLIGAEKLTEKALLHAKELLEN